MKICQAVLKLWSGHKKNVNTQRAITPKVGKPELWFLCSACRLMVFNICVKFHENMSSGFSYGADTKIVNTQRAITPKVGKPELQFMCSARRLMVFNVCVKFMKICQAVLNLWSGHENC